ncbi:MAG: TadE/TadG family type IV pilus assembly protein [Actinomycetes bacterium]
MVEFVLVAPLVLLLALGTIQLTLALYVRNTLIAAAAEGARLAAVAGGSPTTGVALTRGVLANQLAGGVVTDVSSGRLLRSGVAFQYVQVRARLPLVGLLGPASLVVTGHALLEK